MVLPVTGLVENGTAMVPVAAVAQALGYQVIYTPGEDGEGDRIAVESDQFSVQMTVGAVSYTHLDVYKRQPLRTCAGAPGTATSSSTAPVWA